MFSRSGARVGPGVLAAGLDLHLRQNLVKPFVLTSCRDFGTSFPLLVAATQTLTPRKRRKIPNRAPKPEWAKARAWKVMKIDLPDYEFDRRQSREEVSPEERKEKLIKMGIRPVSRYSEAPMYISSSGAVFGDYVPPEGDGKASLISVEGSRQLVDKGKGKGKTMMAVRKIRKYEEDFDVREWVEEAMEIYRNAHVALAERDEDKMHTYVTENAYPEMVNMSKRKTIRWSFVKSLEPPRVVYARTGEVLQKDNLFAQLTVRFYTQQTLAVYDRFGRLIHGSETVAKDVLEYVVFEKHLPNVYAQWRLHSKIIPSWMPAREPGRLTYRVSKEEAEGDQEEEQEKEKEQKEEEEGEESGGIIDRFGRLVKKKE